MNKLIERYKEWLGVEFADLDKYVDYELPVTIRVNTLKISAKELVNRLSDKGVKLSKIDFLKHGYKQIFSNFSLGATPEYLLGYYYMQEAASQLPVELLDPQPGETVLDMAAAPGGKTTQIAMHMNNEGVIVALDTKTKRLEALRNNCARLGVRNVISYNKDARYAEDLGVKFDRILLDAPCSGNFVGDKEWLKKRTVEDFRAKAKVQKQLLEAAMLVLKDKGTLVYSTCSLEREEDEENILWLKDNIDIKILKEKKFWPHVDKTQGFFVAKIKKL